MILTPAPLGESVAAGRVRGLLGTSFDEIMECAEGKLSVVRTPERLALDIKAALYAIATTGKGRCWYCDERLPRALVAIRTGWDVQRIDGDRVASIILVCPSCLTRKSEWGEEEFHRRMAERYCNVTA